jgi:hypothetical protein
MLVLAVTYINIYIYYEIFHALDRKGPMEDLCCECESLVFTHCSDCIGINMWAFQLSQMFR